MNDRLKFRVWDKKSRKMLNVGLIDFRYGKAWFQELISDASPYGILREQDFEIMQCTGLKDKNGKLVFENDIVCVEDWEQDKETGNMINFLGTVYWDNKNLCWSVKDRHNDLTWFDIDGYNIEVIGNIHQNSELLEKGGK